MLRERTEVRGDAEVWNKEAQGMTLAPNANRPCKWLHCLRNLASPRRRLSGQFHKSG